MSASKDPLTLVYECLWDILEANADFTTLVRSDNRIKFTENKRYPVRDSRQSAEHPQVAVVNVGVSAAAYNSSDGSEVTARFAILVRSSDQRVSYLQNSNYQGIFPVQWCVIQAMMDWETPMKALTWNSRDQFVHDCRLAETNDQTASPRLPGQNTPAKADGWNTVWQGDVLMVFPSTGTGGLT